MLCVECGEAVPDLYREVTKGNLRLTTCPRCGLYADRYVEYEPILLVLDLLTHLPPAYRHLTHNTPHTHVRNALLHLIPLYILLTLQLHALRSTLDIPALLSHHLPGLPFSRLLLPALVRLSTPLFPLPTSSQSALSLRWSVDAALVACEFLLYAACVCGLARLLLGAGRRGWTGSGGGDGVAALGLWWSVLYTALLASFPLCWLVVLLVWGYHPLFSYAVDVLLLTSHVQAMAALLRCSAPHSAAIVGTAAAITRFTTASLSLSLCHDE